METFKDEARNEFYNIKETLSKKIDKRKAENLNTNLNEMINSELSKKLDKCELKASNNQMKRKVIVIVIAIL